MQRQAVGRRNVETHPGQQHHPGFLRLQVSPLDVCKHRDLAVQVQVVRAGAQALVAAVAVPGASTAEQAEMLDQMEQVLPGLGDFAPYALDARNRWVGRSLADINLRGATGATVLAIQRGEDAVLTPTGHDTLIAGDVLVLTGTSEAIEAARELLGSR